MQTFTRDLDFVNFNGSEMEWVKYNGVTIYEAWKKLIASGVPPITLQKCKGVDLVDYKIYGNSVQRESENLFDKTQVVSGFLPTSGAYPSTHDTYPNSSYQIIDVKAGQKIKFTCSNKNDTSGRLRCINKDTNEVVNSITLATSEYYTTTATYNNGFVDGEITVKKDFRLGVMHLGGFANLDLQIVSTVPTPDTPIEIESVGEKTKNLFNYRQVSGYKTNGINFQSNSNGSYTANGTLTSALASLAITAGVELDKIEIGETYYASCGNEYNSSPRRYYMFLIINNSVTGGTRYFSASPTSKTFTLSENEYISSVECRIYSTTGELFTVENLILKPIICKESEYVEYEPYGYKIPIKASGKNLLENKNKSTTINDVTFTHNADGSITMNGTNTGNENIVYPINTSIGYAARNMELKAGTYTISHGVTLPKGIYIQAHYSENGTVLYRTSPRSFTNLEDTVAGVYIRFDVGVTANNITIYPQIEKGEIATEYEPYVGLITMRSENLFDKKTATQGVGLSTSTGGTYNDVSCFTTDYIPIAIGETYSLNWSTDKWYCLYDENKNYLNKYSTNNTFTNTDARYIRITVLKEELDTFGFEMLKLPSIYLKEPLRKIGDYADYIDFESGSLISGDIIEMIFTGDENWALYSDKQHTFRFIPNLGIILNGLCSAYSKIYAADLDVKNGIYLSYTRQIIVTDLNYSTADDFKSYLKEQYMLGTPVKLVVKLADKQPSPQTIELPNIPTHKGTNIIEVDTNILPSNMEVKYYGKE